jgi:hypothetical protein
MPHPRVASAQFFRRLSLPARIAVRADRLDDVERELSDMGTCEPEVQVAVVESDPVGLDDVEKLLPRHA